MGLTVLLSADPGSAGAILHGLSLVGVLSPRRFQWTELKRSAAQLSLQQCHVCSMGNTHQQPLDSTIKVASQSFPLLLDFPAGLRVQAMVVSANVLLLPCDPIKAPFIWLDMKELDPLHHQSPSFTDLLTPHYRKM